MRREHIFLCICFATCRYARYVFVLHDEFHVLPVIGMFTSVDDYFFLEFEWTVYHNGIYQEIYSLKWSEVDKLSGVKLWFRSLL